MRYSVLVLGVVLTCCASAVAQQNQPQGAQPPGAPSDPRLDSVLAQWEAKMSGIKSLSAKISRENQDKTFNTRELYVGNAYFQSPNLARLELVRTDNRSIYELFVCTGQFTYVFVPAQKQVRVYEMGALKKGQQPGEDNFLSFLVGMKAADAKVRYQMRFAGEDANYYYLEIKPRNPQDQADFSLAQLALTKKFMPRTLRYTEANGNIVTWDIPDPQVDAPINRATFAPPQTPPGFETKKMPALNAQAAPLGGATARVPKQ
jgi:TIGR03009 family protein